MDTFFIIGKILLVTYTLMVTITLLVTIAYKRKLHIAHVFNVAFSWAVTVYAIFGY